MRAVSVLACQLASLDIRVCPCEAAVMVTRLVAHAGWSAEWFSWTSSSSTGTRPSRRPLFWEHDPGCRLPPETLAAVSRNVFGQHQLVRNWMLGALVAEDVCALAGNYFGLR